MLKKNEDTCPELGYKILQNLESHMIAVIFRPATSFLEMASYTIRLPLVRLGYHQIQISFCHLISGNAFSPQLAFSKGVIACRCCSNRTNASWDSSNGDPF